MFGGWTLGPLLGGWLIEGYGFGTLAVILGGVSAVALALLVFVNVHRPKENLSTDDRKISLSAR